MNAENFVDGSRRVPRSPENRQLGRLVRACSCAAAVIALVLLGPLMLVIALCIWRFDGAPIFFGHFRVGCDGRLFRCLKFRTMRRDADVALRDLLEADPVARAEWERDQKLSADPRITPIGHLLRKTSLDELPQLINVARGQMFLVGPRPITVAELGKYGASRWHYVSVRPGITGLWQVSGRNDTSYSERVQLDATYVERRSVRMDLAILVKTVVVVILRRGAR